MKLCRECGLFCSFGALWPSGLCLPRGDKLTEASNQACVCWEQDWRGVDQSDGVEERDVGTVDPVGSEEDPKPAFQRSAGDLFGPRFKQAELF